MKKALLCVSFGTSVEAARASITAVEETLRAAAPGYLFVRAFTSGRIRRILAGRGEEIPGVGQALEALLAQGCDDVRIQPTHILCGQEYEKLRMEALAYRDRFATLRIGRPLMADTQCLRDLGEILGRTYPRRDGQAYVLFGHGTDHSSNVVYPALQTVLCMAGRPDMVVGTVEGWPGLEDVIPQLRRLDAKRVHLIPLMLVAGDHALNDMQGDSPDSWKNLFEGAGYQVACAVQGLGEIPAIRRLYEEHAAAAVAALEMAEG